MTIKYAGGDKIYLALLSVRGGAVDDVEERFFVWKEPLIGFLLKKQLYTYI